eukprot:g2220.t1
MCTSRARRSSASWLLLGHDEKVHFHQRDGHFYDRAERKRVEKSLQTLLTGGQRKREDRFNGKKAFSLASSSGPFSRNRPSTYRTPTEEKVQSRPVSPLPGHCDFPRWPSTNRKISEPDPAQRSLLIKKKDGARIHRGRLTAREPRKTKANYTSHIARMRKLRDQNFDFPSVADGNKFSSEEAFVPRKQIDKEIEKWEVEMRERRDLLYRLAERDPKTTAEVSLVPTLTPANAPLNLQTFSKTLSAAKAKNKIQVKDGLLVNYKRRGDKLTFGERKLLKRKEKKSNQISHFEKETLHHPLKKISDLTVKTEKSQPLNETNDLNFEGKKKRKEHGQKNIIFQWNTNKPSGAAEKLFERTIQAMSTEYDESEEEGRGVRYALSLSPSPRRSLFSDFKSKVNSKESEEKHSESFLTQQFSAYYSATANKNWAAKDKTIAKIWQDLSSWPARPPKLE